MCEHTPSLKAVIAALSRAYCKILTVFGLSVAQTLGDLINVFLKSVKRCCALMGLLFLLHQQAKMPFDANKLYCSEVLAILLQNNDGEMCPSISIVVEWEPGI